MNHRNRRQQETARIRATATNAVSSTQLTDDKQNHIHGYRSLGFYQCAREVPAKQSSLIVGNGYGNGVKAS